MILRKDWAERFAQECARLPSAHYRSLGGGEPAYLKIPRGHCFLVASGHIKLFHSRGNDDRIVRLILGQGALFGDRPFRESAFRGFLSPQSEQAIAHGRAQILQIDRQELETACRSHSELSVFMLESQSAEAEFLERRLLWQFTSPIRARMAATLRDLISFDEETRQQGYAIGVRLTHQDIADLVGAARPVVSAELSRLRDEGVIDYSRSYFSVDDLPRLDRIALG